MASQFLIAIYKYYVINKMAKLFKKNGQLMSMKTDLRIRCFVASEFLTIEYNTTDCQKAFLKGYLLMHKNSVWEFAWDHG